MWNGEERPFHAVPNCRIWRDSVFLPFKTRFCPRSNPFFTPFFPVLAPFFSRFCPVLVLLSYHIYMHASCSPTIGPRRTITGLRDQWEVCIHGEEMLGTNLRNMSAPARESKRSCNIRKAVALGAPHARKKRRLNGPDEKRGRGGGGDTQSQAPAVARRSQG